VVISAPALEPGDVRQSGRSHRGFRQRIWHPGRWRGSRSPHTPRLRDRLFRQGLSRGRAGAGCTSPRCSQRSPDGPPPAWRRSDGRV